MSAAAHSGESRGPQGSDKAFLEDVRAAVHAHLKDRPKRGDRRLHAKAAIILLWFAASWIALLGAPNFGLRLLAAISLAGASTAIGFSIFHDANHGTFAERRAVNRAFAILSSVLIGPARWNWCVKHNILHHHRPNVSEWDDDIEGRGVLRFTPNVAWSPRFRFQHLTAPIFYTLNTIEWIFFKDFVQYFRGRINRWRKMPRMNMGGHVEFWLSKAAYFSIVTIPPFLVMPWAQALACFFVFHAIFGLAVCLIFLPSHLNREMAFSDSQDGEALQSNQLHATANYGVGDRLTTWVSGGVNYQIEHHIFPHLSHTYLSEIAPIVERTAQAHGIPYHRLGSFGAAVLNHLAFMRDLSLDGARPVP